LNLENGAFIAFMTIAAVKMSNNPIPLPLPAFMIKSTYAVAVFFIAAVVDDIILLGDKIIFAGTLC